MTSYGSGNVQINAAVVNESPQYLAQEGGGWAANA